MKLGDSYFLVSKLATTLQDCVLLIKESRLHAVGMRKDTDQRERTQESGNKLTFTVN